MPFIINPKLQISLTTLDIYSGFDFWKPFKVFKLRYNKISWDFSFIIIKQLIIGCGTFSELNYYFWQLATCVSSQINKCYNSFASLLDPEGQTLTLCAVLLFMTQRVKLPRVMKEHDWQDNSFITALSEHRKDRCNFQCIWFWSSGTFELTCCRWSFRVSVIMKVTQVATVLTEVEFEEKYQTRQAGGQ